MSRQPKRKVTMFSEMPMGLDICFVENSKQVGKRLRYKDPDRIHDHLRAVHCCICW
jgi:hypothetical protein